MNKLVYCSVIVFSGLIVTSCQSPQEALIKKCRKTSQEIGAIALPIYRASGSQICQTTNLGSDFISSLFEDFLGSQVDPDYKKEKERKIGEKYDEIIEELEVDCQELDFRESNSPFCNVFIE